MRAENKKSFLLYSDFAPHLDLLTDTEVGQLFRAVFAYVNNGDIPQNLTPAAAMLFSVLRSQLDRDAEKWADVREKRRAAGRIGAAVTNGKRSANSANAAFDEQKAANPAVNVNVNANGTDIVSDGKADRSKRFTPPSVAEVRAYCEQRHNGIDPEYFVNFYAARGWMMGHTHMKDWKRAVITWETKNKAQATVGAGGEELGYI